MANIFLSYSRVDRPKAQQVAAALEEEGLTVWWDKVLKAGQTYDEVTEGMLRQADVVVVLWSTVSVKSKWVRAEATLGERYSAVVPAMIENADRPILFELTQTADLIGWDGDRSEQRWNDFVTDLRHAISRKAAKVTEPAATEQPTVAASIASAPSLADDGTIENTFWTSIQSSTDAADFTAYLKRYPTGHYSDLARNRLTVLEAKSRAPAPAAAAERAQAAPVPASSPRRETRRKSSMLPLLAGGLVLLVGAGWGVSMILPSGDAGSETVTAIPPEPPVADVVDPQPMESEDEAAFAEASAEPAESEPEVPAEQEVVVEPDPVPAGPQRDCDVCPVVASIPGGTFMMGSPDSERGRVGNEGPVHSVTLAPFVMSRRLQRLSPGRHGRTGGYARHVDLVARRPGLYQLADHQGRTDLSPADRSGMGICGARRDPNGLLVGRQFRPVQSRNRRPQGIIDSARERLRPCRHTWQCAGMGRGLLRQQFQCRTERW